MRGGKNESKRDRQRKKPVKITQARVRQACHVAKHVHDPIYMTPSELSTNAAHGA